MAPDATPLNAPRNKALPKPNVNKPLVGRQRHTGSRRSRPTCEKAQTTLTQYDFDRPAGTGRVTVLDDWSDGEDWAESRPAKRPRKDKSRGDDDGQKTLTQIDFAAFKRSVDSSDGVNGQGARVLGFSGLEPCSSVKEDAEDHQISNQGGKGAGDGDEENFHKPLQSSPSVLSPRRAPVRSSSHYETPRRVRFTEVPSSQTPPTTDQAKLSSKCHVQSPRSPLQEVRGSISPSPTRYRNLASQPVALKMLERARIANSKHSLETENGRGFSMAIELPDDDQIDLDHSLGDRDEASSVTETKSPDRPAEICRRRLKRKIVVQDSQCPDEEERLESEVTTGPVPLPDSSPASHVDDVHDTFEATFDPTNHALDRDAARFGLTQMQRRQDTVDDSETDDDEDLDRGLAPRTATQVAVDPVQEEKSIDRSPAACRDAISGEHNETPRPPVTTTTTASGMDKPCLPAISHVQAEQPAPHPVSAATHPSQVSTVVPTQHASSPAAASPANPSIHTLLPSSPLGMDSQQSLPHPPTSQQSPESTSRSWKPPPLSSSPLPLPPPLSSSSASAFPPGRRMSARPELPPSEAMTDYSLPPPPAMTRGRGGRI